MDARNPGDYPRRVLLAVTGLSPQVVTESLYALAVASLEPFVPTELQVITTSRGAERVRLELLMLGEGWFHRLCSDYELPPITFGEEQIHVLPNASGRQLDDIRTVQDNELTADSITSKVAELTNDPESALHVSLVGGRKTMGFYVGYALSLFGRPQDRLSHVLVSGRYDSHPLFFYPTPDARRIHAPPDQEPLDTSKGVVTLAEIPFVRLRQGISEQLLEGRATFLETVEAAQRALDPPHLIIDYANRQIIAGGVPVPALSR